MTGLNSTAQANVETGVWLLCKEALVSAISDRRLDRMHLCVLACVVEFMNTRTAKAFPDRVTIARILDVKPVSVSNKLRDLREFGYLVGERERVEEAGNRSMMVYTFGHIDHETIRREITSFVRRVREQREPQKSPSTVTMDASKVTEGGDIGSPNAVTVTEGGDSQSAKVTEGGDFQLQKSPSTVNSNSKGSYNNKPTTKKTSVVGTTTRLPDGWFLPLSWGKWSLDTFMVTSDQVKFEAERFRDHWHSVPGARGRKDRWDLTWRNWCRNVKGWKLRTGPRPVDDLVGAAERPKTVDDLYAWKGSP